jgi:hypothetical protein
MEQHLNLARSAQAAEVDLTPAPNQHHTEHAE